jgi:type IV secretory pathway VirB10-like protein
MRSMRYPLTLGDPAVCEGHARQIDRFIRKLQQEPLIAQTELYNVDRVSKSEGLDGLPADYSKLPPKVPELGPPLPGDLGPAIVNSQQPVTPPMRRRAMTRTMHLRKEAEAAAASSVFFRSGNPGKAAAGGAAQVAGCAGSASASRPSTRSPPGRPRRRPSLPTRPPCRTGKTRKRRS